MTVLAKSLNSAIAVTVQTVAENGHATCSGQSFADDA